MSSHKEAPGIANDAAADNTDVYAFVSPDAPNTVTLIANFVPLQNPAGGPNFYEFGEDVLYEIHIDNNGDGVADVTYQFRFDTRVGNPDTFLYNTGTIKTIDDPNWNRKQFYSVSKKIGNAPAVQLNANPLACPPCNVGPASTPNYVNLANAAIHTVGTAKVFAGQRAEGFYVDLGAIFNLGILRPFLEAHLVKMPKAPGVNATRAVNINTIAIQVPKSDLLGVGNGTTTTSPANVIGVYASASRQTSLRYNTDGTKTPSGAFRQISRQGNPLVNEVINHIPQKDRFNANAPATDTGFVQDNVAKPELAKLLGALYPGVFPNLSKYTKPRADLVAILLTGVPKGVVPGFDGNYPNDPANFPGTVRADMLRLNVAIPPKTNKPSNLGLLGGDVAGFPNGRRVFDDVTTIELRAIAGAVLPLVDTSYKSDAAAGAITPGLTSSNTDVTADNTVHYISTFPYLGTPHSGYRNPSNNDPAPDLGAINQPPRSGPIPKGAPETGIGPSESVDKGLLAGSIAAAGVVAAGAVALRPRSADVPAERPRPRPSAD